MKEENLEMKKKNPVLQNQQPEDKKLTEIEACNLLTLWKFPYSWTETISGSPLKEAVSIKYWRLSILRGWNDATDLLHESKICDFNKFITA